MQLTHLIILFQGLNPSKQRFLAPHDSTQGVGPGFYWFSAAFLLFIVLGTVKAFRDEKPWRGRVLHQKEKKKKS
jgi:hypothetical protein